MSKFLSILPHILTAIGAIALAVAGHNYAAAASGAFSIVQQLISVWGVGAVGVASVGAGMLGHAKAVSAAKAELPTPPSQKPGAPPVDGVTHLMGLLGQQLIEAGDTEGLSKLADLVKARGKR